MAEFARSTIDDADLAKYDRLGENGGTRTGLWGPCTSSTPCASAGSATCSVARRSRGEPAAATREAPLSGLRLLDVGSGGGILCESLARLARPWSASIRRPTRRGGVAPCAERWPRHRLPCTTIETLARSASATTPCSSWKCRTRQGRRRLPARCGAHGEARRPAVRRHAHRTMKELRARDRRPSTCCAGCRSAPMIGTSSSRRTSSRHHLVRAGLTPQARAGVSFIRCVAIGISRATSAATTCGGAAAGGRRSSDGSGAALTSRGVAPYIAARLTVPFGVRKGTWGRHRLDAAGREPRLPPQL